MCEFSTISVNTLFDKSVSLKRSFTILFISFQSLDLDKVLQAEQARFTEKFAKLEKQFNDVRREHTKAVVALRQAERQVEREKEKSAEQLNLQQKEYEMKLEKSQSQLRHLEKKEICSWPL